MVSGAYCVTLLSDAGTGDNNFIELQAASGVVIRIYKITVAAVAYSTAPPDTASGRIRIFRASTSGGASLVAGTVVEMNPGASAPSTIVKIKQAGVFANTGTTSDTLLDTAVHLRQPFEWVARDRRDYLQSDAGGFIACRLVNLNSTGNHTFSVYFKEGL